MIRRVATSGTSVCTFTPNYVGVWQARARLNEDCKSRYGIAYVAAPTVNLGGRAPAESESPFDRRKMRLAVVPFSRPLMIRSYGVEL